MEKTNTILVCDDEADIVEGLRTFLEHAHYRVLCAQNGRQALSIIEKEKVDLALMDVMMPGLSGLDTVIQMRDMGCNIPVILLTAKSENADKVLGLDCGADDYVTKPYDTLEVLARVRSHLRRSRYDDCPKSAGEEVLRNGRIEMNTRTKTVYVDGREVHLTRTEYDILHLFMSNIGEIFSLADIYRKIKNEEPYGVENTVAVHIRHLREKIEFDSAHPEYIRVRFGHGYKMENMTEKR